MFEKTHTRRSKSELMVRLCLTSGEAVEGDLFVAQGERLAEVLNDERAFLPLRIGDAVEVIAKTQIARASAIGEAPREATDPYAVLRLPRTASDEELRAAWMNGLKACHPDRLAALDLAPEVVNAARRAAQRVNGAYEAIRAERRAAA